MNSECHCLFRHAITPQERAHASKRLDEAREAGDREGMIILMMSLGKCPSNVNQEVAK